ncbi:hypothetical protein COBT_001337 [Conglomerata obtusa]
MHICTICKESIHIPTKLPCTHKFCLLCIKNHLYARSFCPECFSPTHVCEIKMESGRYESRFVKEQGKVIIKGGVFVRCGEDGGDVVAKCNDSLLYDELEENKIINKYYEINNCKANIKNKSDNNDVVGDINGCDEKVAISENCVYNNKDLLIKLNDRQTMVGNNVVKLERIFINNKFNKSNELLEIIDTTECNNSTFLEEYSEDKTYKRCAYEKSAKDSNNTLKDILNDNIKEAIAKIYDNEMKNGDVFISKIKDNKIQDDLNSRPTKKSDNKSFNTIHNNHFENIKTNNKNDDKFDVFKNEINTNCINKYKDKKKLQDLKPINFLKLTDSQLKKECKNYGLIVGTRKEMIEKLKELYILYSVEKEMVNPISIYGLANVINKKITHKKRNIDLIIKRNINNIFEIRKNFIDKHKNR